VAGSLEHCNEPPSSIIWWGILEQLSDWRRLMKDIALWSYLVIKLVIPFRLLQIAPLSRVRFWKFIVTWLVKLSTVIYGIRRYITLFSKNCRDHVLDSGNGSF
jgi:hypothetical protein